MSTTTNTTASSLAYDQLSNIKETIESLIIAFILAFVFRGFLVEAFVIPTGSMAADAVRCARGRRFVRIAGGNIRTGLPVSPHVRTPDQMSQLRAGRPPTQPKFLIIVQHRLWRGISKNRSLNTRQPEVAERLDQVSFSTAKR